MNIVFYLLAGWFSLWEGMIEPSLPGHMFASTDVLEFLIGYLCLLVAGVIDLKSGQSKDVSHTWLVNEMEGYGGVATMGFSYLSVASAWGGLDEEATGYLVNVMDFGRSIGIEQIFEKNSSYHWLGGFLLFAAYCFPLIFRSIFSMIIYHITIFILVRMSGTQAGNAHDRAGGWPFVTVLISFFLCFLFFEVFSETA